MGIIKKKYEALRGLGSALQGGNAHGNRKKIYRPHSEIEQGYLCMEPVIRIRRMNKQYFLTFKSKGLMARTEHEFPLDKTAYEHLLPKVDGILISKTRYKIPDEHGFIIELDVFHGEYEGLVMAEVEFPSEEVAVEYEGPEWFDDEVTFDSRYQNNNLANK